MNSSIGIRVAAEPRRVFELARDVSRWAELLPHYRRVTVHGTRDDHATAQMVAVRPFRGDRGPGIPVTWRAETWAEGADPDDLRLRFRHIRGVTRGMDVTWHIRPDRDGGASVVIEHRFRRGLPVVGDRPLPWFVDRFFTRPIAGLTLRRFKALAEAG